MVDLHGTLSQIEGFRSFVGDVDRASPLLTSALFVTYSPECVEGEFSEVRIQLFDDCWHIVAATIHRARYGRAA